MASCSQERTRYCRQARTGYTPCTCQNGQNCSADYAVRMSPGRYIARFNIPRRVQLVDAALLRPANVALCLIPVTLPAIAFSMQMLGSARLLAVLETQKQSLSHRPRINLDEDERQALRQDDIHGWPEDADALPLPAARRSFSPSYEANARTCTSAGL